MTAIGAPLLRVSDLEKSFPVGGSFFRDRSARLRAVAGVSLDIDEGETLGLVGESGCGKSTFARCVARLTEPTAGSITIDGEDITHKSMRELRSLRRAVQLVFQDPMASLNPRKRVGAILGDALRVQRMTSTRREERERVLELLGQVGLSEHFVDRLPRELSGGQRQRIGIARALALRPKLIVADEPVSALDVSVQAQILNLLKELQERLKLTMLFISHDLGVIRHVSDRVGVMYLGKLVELAPADTFYARPMHPYSSALLAAIPLPDPGKRGLNNAVLEGDIPSPVAPPSGCRFHTRCPVAKQICAHVEPLLEPLADRRLVACHFAGASLAT